MRDRDWIWIAVVACGTGLAALSCDQLRLPGSLPLEARTVFGIVASGVIALVLLEKIRHPESITRQELYLWTRLVSRWVYIFMYVLALARIGFFLGESYLHYTVRPLDDFQFYIACCVIPLWAVRAAVLTVPVLKGTPSEDPMIEAASSQDSRRVA